MIKCRDTDSDLINGCVDPGKARTEPLLSVHTAANGDRPIARVRGVLQAPPAPAKQSGLAWGMGGWTSQVQQTLAALKAFGLVDYQRSGGNLQVAISDAGRTYLRAEQESAKQEVLRRAALTPKSIAKYFKDWGLDRPPDPVCLQRLIRKDGFTEAAARIFLSVYDGSLAYGGIGTSDQPDAAEEEMAGEGERDVPPPPAVKIGDYVQWAPKGVEQFNPPRQVTRIEGGLAFVVPTNWSGIPVGQVIVVDAPELPAIGTAQASTRATPKSAAAPEIVKDIDVRVLSAERLQITAEVDKAGIAALRQMLDKYEDILDMLAAPKPEPEK